MRAFLKISSLEIITDILRNSKSTNFFSIPFLAFQFLYFFYSRYRLIQNSNLGFGGCAVIAQYKDTETKQIVSIKRNRTPSISSKRACDLIEVRKKQKKIHNFEKFEK